MTCGRIIDCEQNTPEWHAARCGRVTGSRIADIMRKTKTGPSAMRETYLGELVAERLSGVQEDGGFVSQAMQHGKDNEATARTLYEFMHDCEAQLIGFVVHPKFEMAGASPDCFIGEDGGLEIKCPNSKTHIQTLLGSEPSKDYVLQCQWNMACAGRDWWDLVSFDPRFPANMQMHVTRIKRDKALIADLESAVAVFLSEVESTTARLLEKFEQRQAA